MQVQKTITTQTPVTRQVSSTNAEGETTTSTVTEIKTETKTVTVEVPDKNEDKKVDKSEFQNSEQYKSADAKQQEALDRVYTRSDGDGSGSIDTDDEFSMLAQGMAEEQHIADSVATVERAQVRPLDDTSPQTFQRDKEASERSLGEAETALANVPTDHPDRARLEQHVSDLQGQYTERYGERAHPEPSSLAPAEPEQKPEPAAPVIHEVKPGDTLGAIASRHGVTLDELREANPHLFVDGADEAGKKRDTGGNWIYPGDQVTIPQKPPANEVPEETPPPNDASADPAQQAADAIKGTELFFPDPELERHLPEEDRDAIRDENRAKVESAQGHLEQIPADHPARAEAEAKVKELEDQYTARYGPLPGSETSTPPTNEGDGAQEPAQGGGSAPADEPHSGPPAPGDTDFIGPVAPATASTPEVQENLDRAAGAAARGDDTSQRQALDEAVKKAKSRDDLLAIAHSMEQADPERAKAIRAAGDSRIDDKVRKELIDALEDDKNTRGDLQDALRNADTPEEFRAIAQAAGLSSDEKLKAAVPTIEALADPGVSTEVRKKLLDSLKDDRNSDGDVFEALRQASTPEDFKAIEARIGHLSDSDKQSVLRTIRDRIDGASVEDLEAFAKGAEALGDRDLGRQIEQMSKATDPKVRNELSRVIQEAQYGYRVTDNLKKALENAKSPEDFRAIADIARLAGEDGAAYRQVGDFGRLSEGVRGELVNAVKDNRDTDGDLNRALVEARTAEDFEAIARVAREKGLGQVAILAEQEARRLREQRPPQPSGPQGGPQFV